MATRTQLLAQRDAAGSRYAAAVTELRASLVDLAALDAALANRTVSPADPSPAPTFHGVPDSLPWELQHPIYAPRYSPTGNTVTAHWRNQITAARDTYVSAFTAG